MTIRRSWFTRVTTLLGIGTLTGVVVSTPAHGQQSFLDPYKPYSRSYQAFADPSAAIRPGFPNPMGGSGRPTYGTFDPFGATGGGFDPFASPYYNNRLLSPSLGRSGSALDRSLQDYSRRPGQTLDPQERVDREFYQQLQRREDPYYRLQKQREDLYFQALQEPDLKKRTELLRQYQRASARSAQALSTTRRLGPTPPRRLPATPSGTARPGTTAPSTTPPSAPGRTGGATQPAPPQPGAATPATETPQPSGTPSVPPGVDRPPAAPPAESSTGPVPPR